MAVAAAASTARKVYFAGSIRGGRADAALYGSIIEALRSRGNEVLTEHVGAASLDKMGEAHMTEAEIYDRDMQWLRKSRAVVAECTVPSLGVGYELGQAEALGIPVLVLFRPAEGRSLSAMLRGNGKFSVHEYSDVDDAMLGAVDSFLDKACA